MAVLKKDRISLFKQFITDEHRKNSDINKTLMTQKIPKIDEAFIPLLNNTTS